MKKLLRHASFAGKISLIVTIILVAVIGLPLVEKSFAITIDGSEQQVSVNGLYAKDVLTAVNEKLNGVEFKVNNPIDEQTLIADLAQVDIVTKKHVSTIVNDKEIKDSTFATTVEEYLQDPATEVHQVIGDVSIDDKTALESGTIFEVHTVEEDLGVEVRENEEVEKGVEQVIQEGKPKRTLEVKRKLNGEPQAILLITQTIDDGLIHIIERGSKSIAPTVPTGSVWDQLANCESGGNWNTNTGNGYYGGLQFSAPTWDTASRAVGLDIPYASDATREEQILAASWLQERSGWGQWPACTSKLGLR